MSLQCCLHRAYSVVVNLTLILSPFAPDSLSCCWTWRNIILNSTLHTSWSGPRTEKKRGNFSKVLLYLTILKRLSLYCCIKYDFQPAWQIIIISDNLYQLGGSSEPTVCKNTETPLLHPSGVWSRALKFEARRSCPNITSCS